MLRSTILNRNNKYLKLSVIMKTYKEFIQESSLARIKSKSDKGGMATLSASRADKSAKENRARAKQLDKDIRGKGLGGATKVTGSYLSLIHI